MKKIAIILLSVLILTGCGNKTLVCNKVEDETEIYVVSGEHTIEFKGNEINDFTSVVNIELKDTSVVKIDDFKEVLETQEKQYSDEGFKTKISTKGNKSSLSISSKGNSKELVNKFFYTEDYSYNYIKESLEKEGYTCK